MSASEQSLSVQRDRLTTAAGLMSDQQLVEEFTGAVAALQSDPTVLGDQARLVEAVAAWAQRWQPASRLMTNGLQAGAELIEAAAQAYSRQDAAMADDLSAVASTLG